MPTSHSKANTSDNPRYRRAVRAAEELFKRIGFRAVTMELVAQEADIAKATLYSFFPNKDALYGVVCARMARLLRRAVEDALADPERALDERLARAVIAKHRLVFDLVRSSPHATELLSYTDAVAGDVFAELDTTLLALFTAAIAEDPQLAPDAERLARALFLGTAELANRAASAADMETELGAFIAVHLAGARALAEEETKP